MFARVIARPPALGHRCQALRVAPPVSCIPSYGSRCKERLSCSNRIPTIAVPFGILVKQAINGHFHAAISTDRPGHAFMKVGYARVSTKKQKLDFQIHALQQAGCDIVIAEKISGRERRKPGLAAAMASCRTGDTLVVWKIDRLGRDVVELVHLVRLLRSSGAGLQVLSGRAALIDVSTVEGRALYSIHAAFADLEHEWGRERTIAGLKQAKRKTETARSRGVQRRQRRSARHAPLRRAFNRSC